MTPRWLLAGMAGLADLAGRTRRERRLAILMYHRVLPQPDPLYPGDLDARTFEWQMDLLARHFRTLRLDLAVEYLRAGALPRRAVCVTFDDGYADNVDVALPILSRAGIPATFFIATGYLDGGMMWNDAVKEAVRVLPGRRLELVEDGLGSHSLATQGERVATALALVERLKRLPPERRQRHADELLRRAGIRGLHLMMGAEQVRELCRAGMEVGAHTISHPILMNLPREEAQRELAGSKGRLETLTGGRVTLLAYPNGIAGYDYGPEHVAMARACGFAAAVSTRWGSASRHSDLWQLPRFTPWDRRPERFMLRLVQNYHRAA